MQIASHDSGNATQPFTAKRLSDALAAEIEGVDLSQPIGGTMKDAIYDALLQHHVLVFRNQALTRAQQGIFATNYGELEGHVGRLRNGERYPVINDITNIQPDGKKIPELENSCVCILRLLHGGGIRLNPHHRFLQSFLSGKHLNRIVVGLAHFSTVCAWYRRRIIHDIGFGQN